MFPAKRRSKMHPVGPAVDGMLCDLGRENLSYGSFKQSTQAALFNAAPAGRLNKMMYGAMKKSYQADMERLKKEGGSIEEWLHR